MTGVTDLVKKEYRTEILHNDMDISRLMVYAQSIEESKLKMMTREFKTGRYDEKGQPTFNKRSPNQDSLSARKVIQERSCGSQFAKPTYTSSGKRPYTKCLSGTNGYYGCVKNDQKV